jgi:repressor LexA
MDKLTKKQQAVLDYIIEFVHENGYQPSYREMMAEFDIASPNGIACHLRALKAKGRIEMPRSEARAIRILKED